MFPTTKLPVTAGGAVLASAVGAGEAGVVGGGGGGSLARPRIPWLSWLLLLVALDAVTRHTMSLPTSAVRTVYVELVAPETLAPPLRHW